MLIFLCNNLKEIFIVHKLCHKCKNYLCISEKLYSISEIKKKMYKVLFKSAAVTCFSTHILKFSVLSVDVRFYLLPFITELEVSEIFITIYLIDAYKIFF